MSVLSSRVKKYHSALPKIPEENRSRLHRGGNLKPLILNVLEKGVLRQTSRRRIGDCKIQIYILFSSSNVLGYQSNEDGTGGLGEYCTHSKENADRISMRKTKK
jgi:hypothetical protein